jgi:hypothetical protein
LTCRAFLYLRTRGAAIGLAKFQLRRVDESGVAALLGRFPP